MKKVLVVLCVLITCLGIYALLHREQKQEPLTDIVIEWKYRQQGRFESSLFSGCGVPADPQTPWQLTCKQTNNYNICQFPIDSGIIKTGCEFAIQTPGSYINGCDFNQNGKIDTDEYDQWFPTGNLDQKNNDYCSGLDRSDGNVPGKNELPNVSGIYRNGEEIPLKVSVIQHPWGWNYKITF